MRTIPQLSNPLHLIDTTNHELHHQLPFTSKLVPIVDGLSDATMASKSQPFQYKLAIANLGAV